MKYLFVFILLTQTLGISFDLENIPDDPQLIEMYPSYDDGQSGSFLPSSLQYVEPEFDQQIQTENLIQTNKADTIVEVTKAQQSILDLEQFLEVDQQEQTQQQPNYQLVGEPQDYKSEISILQQSSNENKLNQDILSKALKEMLDNVQNARDVESASSDRKEVQYSKMQKLHERSDNNIKLDIARNSKQLSESSEPLQQELSEALKYRESIYAQIKDQMSANDVEYELEKKNMKTERDEASIAQEMIDKMVDTLQEAKTSSFLQVKDKLTFQHKQIQELYSKHENEPIAEIVATLAQVFTSKFKDNKIIQQALKLLDQLRSLTLDYKLKLIEQKQKQEFFYLQRKLAIENDKKTNDEIYASKLEQYMSVQSLVISQRAFLKERDEDKNVNTNIQDFWRNAWSVELVIGQTVDRQLLSNAGQISDAIKQVETGTRIPFQGEMLNL